MIDLSSLTLADILPFVAVGFAAQLVDGALGMAFGVLSSTLLVALGMPPAQVSAAVHAVESFTTAASGTNHLIHRNIDWRLFGRLVIPGVIGGVAGAYLLTHVDASLARPFVLGYLGLLAIFLIWRGLRHRETSASPRYVAPLGLVGGFLDAAGGGGWGPIVTSNLLAQAVLTRMFHAKHNPLKEKRLKAARAGLELIEKRQGLVFSELEKAVGAHPRKIAAIRASRTAAEAALVLREA